MKRSECLHGSSEKLVFVKKTNFVKHFPAAITRWLLTACSLKAMCTRGLPSDAIDFAANVLMCFGELGCRGWLSAAPLACWNHSVELVLYGLLLNPE
jgi:hypothetical protein